MILAQDIKCIDAFDGEDIDRIFARSAESLKYNLPCGVQVSLHEIVTSIEEKGIASLRLMLVDAIEALD